MAPPSNTTALTAINITSLPYTNTQSVHDAGTTYDVWYKYTTVTGDKMLGVWGFGGTVGSGYQPLGYVYGPNDSTLEILSAGVNKAYQFYSQVGSTYYFRFRTNNATITPANLSVSILKFAETSYIVGDLFVNDDNQGFPLTILSQVDASPRKFIPSFPAGEAAATLDNGTILVSDVFDENLKIYNSSLALVTTITSASFAPDGSIVSNRTNTFYSVDNSTSTNKIWKITSTGIVTGPVATISTTGVQNVQGIAISPDESILYYKMSGGTNFNKILRHNLTTNIPMSDLVGVLTDYNLTAREILCLEDGTIIAAYTSAISTRDNYLIKRYNADGSTANTYTSPGSLNASYTVRFAYAIDDPNSFWVWYESVINPSSSTLVGTSTFLNIKVSDGSILKNITGHQYETGVYSGAQSATPDRFGHSESCPFLILRVGEGGDGGGGGTPPTGDPSGIYQVKRGKTNETLYTGTTPSTQVRKIPDPFIKTSLIGS